MTREKAAQVLVENTFGQFCFEKESFTSDDIRQACIDLIDKELEKTEFITQIIGE